MRDAEKERTVDLKHLYARWNPQLADGLGVAALLQFVFLIGRFRSERRNPGDLRHASHEQERSENHADSDGYGDIGEHSEGKSGQQYGDVAAGSFEQHPEPADLAHVPGHYDQNRRQYGEWNAAGQRRQQQEDEEQRDGVDHARDGGPAAAFDVGDRARDRARRAESSKENGADIGDPLGDQFGVRPMPRADHAVSDHRREERLDG